MNHADVQRQMADYLEGDLALDRRALFDAHLDECAECAAEVVSMQDTISLLRSLPEPQVPAGFSSQVMRRVRSGEGDRGLRDWLLGALDTLFAPKLLYPVSVAMIAAGVLLATGQVQLIQQTTPTRQTSGSDLIVRLSPGTGSSAAPAADERRQLVGALAATEPTGPGQLASGGDGTTARMAPEREFMRVVPIEELVMAQQQTRPPWARNARSTGTGGAVSVATSPGIGAGGGARGGMPRPAAASDRDLPTTDEWLSELVSSPTVFAARLSRLTLAEQELWVQSLARHAAEQGRLDEVIEALRRGPTADARLLADDFAAVGERSRAATARADSSGGD